ncbi:MAG: DUF547 domain-containing protein [Gammaproteobacteria bacterium]|nr:DUF547 domain-containing protein [Gammaproteobacteria bacterium]
MKTIGSAILAFCGLLAVQGFANAAEQAVPERFQRYDDNSKYVLNYDDLTAMLDAVVVDVGRSDRSKAPPTQAKTGTRAQVKINRATINEGNRFYFETFEDNEANKQAISAIQQGIENATSEVGLENFSRNEQLAYWLNLYNATVLNEIVKVYPQRDLEKLMYGKNSILSQKLLTVEGVPLSLDDIQFTILRKNYNGDPLILYGLYQGVISGPSIRKAAYTGANVYDALAANAREFINSNRGTASQNAKKFRVSSFYERNKAFFPNFEADLTAHILEYVEGDERTALQSASTIKPDISDWTVTDLGGTRRVIGGSFSDSSAALMGSVNSSAPASVGGSTAAITGSATSGGINSALIKQVQEKEESDTDEDDSDEKSDSEGDKNN